MTRKLAILTLLLGTLIVFSSTAEAMTAQVTATAERDSFGFTRFHIKVCVCMSSLEVIAYNAAGGGGTVSVSLPKKVCVTENDIIDDDELPACLGAGIYSEPFSWTHPYGCPPAPPVCVEIGVTRWISNSQYGNENPGDFQLGEAGQEEGTVPAGTSVNVSTTNLTATSVGMPNTSS